MDIRGFRKKQNLLIRRAIASVCVFVLFFQLVTPASVALAQKISQESQDTVQTLTILPTQEGVVSIREEANIDTEKIGEVHPGESYAFVQEQYDWYKIIFGDDYQQGWVSGVYVGVNDAAETVGEEDVVQDKDKDKDKDNEDPVISIQQDDEIEENILFSVITANLDGDTLALRKKPSTKSKKRAKIDEGEKLDVFEVSEDEQWYRTIFDGEEGWITVEFTQELEEEGGERGDEEDEGEENDSDGEDNNDKDEKDDAQEKILFLVEITNLDGAETLATREEPSTDSDVLVRVIAGEEFAVYEISDDAQWYRILLDDTEDTDDLFGWISVEYAREISMADTDEEEDNDNEEIVEEANFLVLEENLTLIDDDVTVTFEQGTEITSITSALPSVAQEKKEQIEQVDLVKDDLSLVDLTDEKNTKEALREELEDENLQKQAEQAQESFALGKTDEHLVFSVPAKVQVKTDLDDGESVTIRVRHVGDDVFNTVGITLNGDAVCDTDGLSSDENNTAVVQDGIITFYTCGASTFILDPDGDLTNEAVLWLKADAGTSCTTDGCSVDTWADQSGNSNDVTAAGAARPSFNTSNTINFNPALTFDGVGNFMAGPDVFGGSNSENNTFFVHRINSYSQHSTIKFKASTATNDRYAAFYPWTDGKGYWDAGSFDPGERVPTTATLSLNMPYLSGLTNSVLNSDQTIRLQGRVEASDGSGHTIATDAFELGNVLSGGQYLDGSFVEVIVYEYDLSVTEKNQIESYLALKYGITLDQSTAQDYLASDGVTEMWDKDTADAPTYDDDITGVGRDDDSSLGQVKSKSVNTDAIITIEAVGEGTNASPSFTDIDDREFLTFGNNDGASSWTTTGAPSGYQILSRQWSEQEHGGDSDIGSTTLDFDVADADFDVPATFGGGDYYFIYDADNDGDLSDEIPTAMTDQGSNIWRATVDFNNGMKFGVVTQSAVPPAPTISRPITGTTQTNDTTPLFSGTGTTPGNTIRLYEGVTLVGTGTVSPSGSWEAEVDSALIDGIYTFTAREFDGSESADSNSVILTIFNLASTGDLKCSIEINDNTTNGPVLSNGDRYGISITSIGDLDGDGVTDIAVGAFLDDTGGTDRGAVHINFLNSDGSVKSTVEINDLTANGPVLSNGDRYGISITSIGDLDGDGVTDVTVGAFGDDAGGTDRGAVHISFLNSDGSVKSTVEINDLTANGPVLSNGDQYGISITSIGDLDGDGVTDIAVGAFLDDAGGTDRGTVHINFLNSDGSVKSTVEINDLTANGPVLSNGDRYSRSTFISDLDSDGVTDIAIGAFLDDAGGADRGAVHISFLNSDGSVKGTVEINDTTTNGPVLNDDDRYGTSITSIGDLDGDGVTDLVAGADFDDAGGTDRGATHLNFLLATGAPSLESAIVDGVTLTLDYDQNVDAPLPVPGDFTVLVNATARTVVAVGAGVTSDLLELTLSPAVNLGDTVTLTYDALTATNQIEDSSAREAACLNAQSVTNTTPPPNQPPTDIAIDGANADTQDENTATNTNIGVLTTTDPDGGDTHTYSLACTTPGADDSHFNISGTDLRNTTVFDFETPLDTGADNTYDICVRTFDGVNNYDELLTVTINDLNTAPTNIDIDGANTDNQDENTTTNTTISTITSTDDGEDNTEVYTYTLSCTVPGVDDAHFNISGTDLRNTTVFDYETPADTGADNTYDICIRVTETNGGLTYDENLTVTVNNKIADNSPVISAPLTGTQTNDTTPLFSGTGITPGNTIRLYEGVTLVGTGTVSPSGSWEAEVDSALIDGIYTFTAREFDGSESADSNSVILTIFNLASTGDLKCSIEINDNTTNGPVLSNGDRYSRATASIGDLDGDGVADIAIGAFLDDAGGTDRGAVHINFLNSDGSVKSVTEINDTTPNGPVLSNSDFYGTSVASIGDIDGDGVVDLAAGAYRDDAGGADRGALHVLFMNSDGSVKSTVEINDNTPNGPVLSNGDFYGASVASIGDLDGDGVTDVAVGAFGDNAGGTDRGTVHISFLNSDGSVKSTVEINDTTTNGPVLSNGDFYGVSVASIGDLDGDGVADLAVGAYLDDAGGTDRGTVHIIFLNSDGSVKSTVEINDTTTNGPVLSNGDQYGVPVTSIGDLDGDGVADLAVGAYLDDAGGADRGAIHISFLNSDGSVKSTVEINDTTPNGPVLNDDDRYGTSVAFIGDLDGDGVTDVAVGAFGDDTGGTDRGATHLNFLLATGASSLESAIVDSVTLTLDYDQNVDAPLPVPGDFTVLVNATARTVVAVGAGVTSDLLELTLSPAVNLGDTVTLTYDALTATNQIEDSSAREAACLNAQSVTNTTPPPNQAPTDIQIDGGNTDNQDENTVTNTNIGVLTTTDPDGGDTHTYSLACTTPGADDSHFTISGGQLQNATVFDYEFPVDADIDNTYEVCVRTTDSGTSNLSYDETLTIDVDNVVESTGCSLREAMHFVNNGNATTNGPVVDIIADESDGLGCSATGGVPANTIHFNISGGGVHTIAPTTSLPSIFVRPMTIDGESQPSASCGNDFASRNILIEVNGGQIVGSSSIFDIAAGGAGTTIKGLSIYGAETSGISISSDDNTIICNHIGVDASGMAAGTPPNTFSNIYISGDGDNTQIGGDTFAELNVISGSAAHGITMFAGNNVKIQGNYIGLGLDGTSMIPNVTEGMSIYGGFTPIDGLLIGGTTPGEGNVISGNGTLGVAIAAITNTTVQGNIFGLNAAGDAARPNTVYGFGAFGNGVDGLLIGGATAGARNIISGNNNIGIYIDAATNITIKGNYIGTARDGLSAIGNGGDGVSLSAASSNINIGGRTVGERNIISGNAGGISIDAASDVFIEGNYIGLGADGNTLVPNTPDNGVLITGSSPGVVIGGTAPGAGNVISGNGTFFNGHGILVSGADHVIQGNIIGLDATGTLPRGNGTAGVLLLDGSDGVQIGGDSVGARNIISANSFYGIVSVGGVQGPATSQNNSIQGNYIGTDNNGNVVAGLGNSFAGVGFIGDSQNNLLGGTGIGEGNLIAGNDGPGVKVMYVVPLGFVPGGNAILGNSIIDNVELGIDHSIDNDADFAADEHVGVSVNDIGDVDTGPNGLQNYPVIYDLDQVGGGLARAFFYLDSTVAGDFRVEGFHNPTPDASGHGEGEIFVGATTISHTGSGVESFSIDMSALSGESISLTATEIDDSNSTGFGATSEFGPNAIVESLGPDFGDNPDTGGGTGVGNYNTVVSDNGAYHIIGDLYLGQCVDSDTGSHQGTTAEADDSDATIPRHGALCNDDEDGVFFSTLQWGVAPNVDVIINDEADGINDGTTVNAILDVWIDLNVNGNFEDAGEHIVQSSSVSEGTGQTTTDSAVGSALSGGSGATVTYARVRLASATTDYPNNPARPIGEALIGEVEDYQVTILDSGTASIGGTVTNDDTTIPFDGVIVKLYLDDGDGSAELGADDSLVTSQSTVTGVYDFTNLPAGSYWVNIDTAQATLVGYTQNSGAMLSNLITLTTAQDYSDGNYGFTIQEVVTEEAQQEQANKDDDDDDELKRPRDLTCTVGASDSIRLDWNDKAHGENGFYIQRKTESSEWETVKTLSTTNAEDWTDTDLEQGQTYHYAVRSYKGDDTSKSSAVVSCTLSSATTSASGQGLTTLQGAETTFEGSSQQQTGATIDHAPEGLDSDEREEKTQQGETIFTDQCNSWHWIVWVFLTLVALILLTLTLRRSYILIAAITLSTLILWYFFEQCHIYWWVPVILIIGRLLRAGYVWVVEEKETQ